MPCLEWLRYPITLLLSARGCTEDCAVCGGSRSAYRRICHRERHILSYETDAMTRDQIVRTTHDVAERLNEIKHRRGVIDDATFSGVEMRLRAGEELIADYG